MSDAVYTLADTWRLNQRVNLQLLGQLNDAQLAYSASPRSRNIGDQLAHLHNVRIQCLDPSRPDAAKPLKKINKGTVTRKMLQDALEASAEAIGELFDEAAITGKLKAFPRGLAAFLGYLLAHEAHHRGQIILHLKYAKMPIDPTVGYSLRFLLEVPRSTSIWALSAIFVAWARHLIFSLVSTRGRGVS